MPVLFPCFFPQCFGAAQHLLRGNSFRCFRPHLLALQLQGRGLPKCVRPHLLAPPLIIASSLQVLVPTHVVGVQGGAGRIQIDHSVHGAPNQSDVVTDDHDRTLVSVQKIPEPQDGVVVQVVRGLIEEESVGFREEDPSQLDPALLATRKFFETFGEHLVPQT